MYDFVSDKFNKMGLSFLNSVAKMVSSAASAKLMDLMFGDFTRAGRWVACLATSADSSGISAIR